MSAKKTTGAVAFFCDGIREEVERTTTFVGVMPGNVTFEGKPGHRALLPRLGIVVLIHAPVDNVPSKVTVRIEPSWDSPLKLRRDFSADMIRTEAEQSKKQGHELLQMWVKMQMTPVPVVSDGYMDVIAELDGEEHLAGRLRIREEQKS